MILLYSRTISIHALRKERDAAQIESTAMLLAFQSTRSARSATQDAMPDFGQLLFQSTRSARSATSFLRRSRQLSSISIHALRKERDRASWRCSTSSGYFNPRAPQGARPSPGWSFFLESKFQSTRSARSATQGRRREGRGLGISIHALRKERDRIDNCGHASVIISIHALRKERDPRSWS